MPEHRTDLPNTSGTEPAGSFPDTLSSGAEEITGEWLKSVGFKWHQFDRQPDKQWLLWLGGCVDCGKTWRFNGPEDFGIELAPNGFHGDHPNDAWWFCWFRGDSAGRYHRFIHVRHLRTRDEVVKLVEALSGRPWNTRNHIGGALLCNACGDRWRAEEAKRMDLRERERRTKWYDIEKDDTRGRALPEHMEEAIKRGGAK